MLFAICNMPINTECNGDIIGIKQCFRFCVDYAFKKKKDKEKQKQMERER